MTDEEIKNAKKESNKRYYLKNKEKKKKYVQKNKERIKQRTAQAINQLKPFYLNALTKNIPQQFHELYKLNILTKREIRKCKKYCRYYSLYS